MESALNSFLIVAAAEMGDRTQLLSLVLTARYKQPWMIFAGVLVATLLNHGLAAGSGAWIAASLSPMILRYLIAGSFLAFAFWVLKPDKEGDTATSKYGPFFATAVAFFFAEMGDKTQLATVALAARYQSVVLVTVGTTFGMLFSNALVIFFGDRLTRRIPLRWIRYVTAVAFAVFGVLVLLG